MKNQAIERLSPTEKRVKVIAPGFSVLCVMDPMCDHFGTPDPNAIVCYDCSACALCKAYRADRNEGRDIRFEII